jgi:3-hydroxyacyl-[acyl-carrier-protein] dehydratase
MIDLKRIMELIPHRYPFLLVDRVVEMVKGDYALGLKNVTLNEHFFLGHFPDHPVMPGVLIIEALAQTSAILVAETDENAAGKIVYFTSIEEVKFRKPVFPGDQLMLRATALKHRKNLWKFEVSAEVNGVVVTDGYISAMIMGME